jgi:hypothetical protein
MCLAAPMLGAELAPLKCPEGTHRRERTDTQGSREEWCEDLRSGLKHGTARAYDAKGTFIGEETWDKGVYVSTVLTRAGTEGLLREINAALKSKRLPWEYSLVDERKVRLAVNTQPPANSPAPDAATVKKDLVSDEQACIVFRIPGVKFETLEVRYRRPDGSSWLTVEVKRAECLRG